MHACKSHEPKANHALRHPFSASDLKSELKSQVLISDRAHQLESVILTLVAVGHKKAGNVATSFPKHHADESRKARHDWPGVDRNARKRNKGARRGAHHIQSTPLPRRRPRGSLSLRACESRSFFWIFALQTCSPR